MLLLNDKIGTLFARNDLPACGVTLSGLVLYLQGPCGENLLKIKNLGVKALKTQKEKDLVFKVVEDWLKENLEDLKEFFKNRQEQKKLKEEIPKYLCLTSKSNSPVIWGVHLLSHDSYTHLSKVFEDESFTPRLNGTLSKTFFTEGLKEYTRLLYELKVYLPKLQKLTEIQVENSRISTKFNSCKF